jgi:hypothetical protein
MMEPTLSARHFLKGSNHTSVTIEKGLLAILEVFIQLSRRKREKLHFTLSLQINPHNLRPDLLDIKNIHIFRMRIRPTYTIYPDNGS